MNLTIDDVEPVLKVLAVLAAAAFFLWKILTGWLIINLQVSLDLKRQELNEHNDLLAIQVNLKKGTTDTLRVRDIALRITFEDKQRQPIVLDIPEIHLLPVSGRELDWRRLVAGKRTGRMITLSPGESAHFGRLAYPPKDIPALVEVIVLGARIFWPKSFQWRSSAVSLPIISEGKASGHGPRFRSASPCPAPSATSSSQ